MPFFEKLVLSPQSVVGIWQITENVDELLAQIKLSPEEIECFNSFQSNERKKQWLSYRILLNALINKPNCYCSIFYDNYGKPYISPAIGNISITHSGEFSAIIFNDSKAVGIDIEKIRANIINISPKFLAEDELNQVDLQNICQLTMYWCAKEAIYKLHGLRDITFKNNIYIKPFSSKENEGIISGILRHYNFFREITLCYKKINEYMLVYTIDN